MTPKQAMIANGAPKALFMTAEQRRKAWIGVPVRQIPFAQVKTTRNEDEATAAFRAAEEERRRQKSLAGIQRMKNRFAAKAVDLTKMRWDPRRNKFVEDNHGQVTQAAAVVARPATSKAAKPAARPEVRAQTSSGTLTKDNAEAVAKLNGVWKDSYEKLRGTGRIVMTVGNVLKGIANRGGTVKWQ